LIDAIGCWRIHTPRRVTIGGDVLEIGEGSDRLDL
jgi:hypothetical protein